MLEQRRRSASLRVRRLPWPALVGCSWFLAACAHSGPTGQPAADSGPWGRALAGVAEVHWGVATAEHLAGVAAGTRGLFVVDDNWRLPTASLAPALRNELAQFVRGGGRLVLFGHAAQLATELGVEAAAPQRSVWRWGFDARALEGSARLGVHVVSAEAAALFEGVPLAPGTEATYWLAGGTPCTAPLCAWSIEPPRSGQVLARLAVLCDRIEDSPGAPVLVQWSMGEGAVLACGLAPRLDHEDDAVRSAAVAFVQRCAHWAKSASGLVLLATPDRTPAPAARSEMPPLAPLVPHWGWQFPHALGGDERSVDELVADVLTPAWQAGADLGEIDLVASTGATPIGWPANDPLRPAPSFESQPEARVWQSATFRALAAEAHARGMLAYGALDPLPVGERTTERLATLRFLARELACVRRFAAGALDGFRVRRWLRDNSGYSAAMVQDFAPSSRLWGFGVRAPDIAGSLRGIDAEDGALAGLPLGGSAAGWRDGLAADLFPHGVLAAEVHAGGRGEHGICGNHGDWIVEQANDFVRARAGRGASMWWRRHDPAALDRDTVAYVEGVSLEPLRAAVAMPLTATGNDGVRAAAATLVQGAPASFAARAGAPAAVHVLQNNWFRLQGTGGRLEFDALGQARFHGATTVLADSFLRTRMFGGRPDPEELGTDRTDFLARGQRGEGGYVAVAYVGGGAGDDEMPPAVLQRAAAPAWPEAVVLQWTANVGYHELELAPRGVKGRGVLTVALDGVVLSAVPFDASSQVPAVTVPVHVARAGARRLQLAVAIGGGVAIDRAILRRVRDVGVEASVLIPAGSTAALRETSQSSYHHEQIELSTLADQPGFLLTVRCERAVRNLQVERAFAWLAPYRLEPGANASASELRQPFLLTSPAANVPDVVIVPLQFARYEMLRWRDGKLTWHAAPEAGMKSRLGVWFCRSGEGRQWLAHAAAVLSANAEPMVVDLGPGGEADLHSDLPLPWTRLVRVLGSSASPFSVREQGLWQWRGSQASSEGGRWLRVQHTPGDVVKIVGGPSLLARTRPGPGSLRLLALRDPEPGAVTVQVLQPPLLGPPCVVMGTDFDEVRLDGSPWAHFDGRTIWLPSQLGTYAITTRAHAGAQVPHVRAAGAPLTACRYMPETKELVLATPGVAERPAELPWTAILAGPRPTAIENGEIVEDGTLRWADVEQAAAAARGGVLIRFRNGVTKVRYGD